MNKKGRYFTLSFSKCSLPLLSPLSHSPPPIPGSPTASLDLLKIFKTIFLLNISKFSLMSNACLYQWPQPTYVLYPERLLCSERNAGLFSVIMPEQSWKGIPSLHTLKLHRYLYIIDRFQLHITSHRQWCK